MGASISSNVTKLVTDAIVRTSNEVVQKQLMLLIIKVLFLMLKILQEMLLSAEIQLDKLQQ